MRRLIFTAAVAVSVCVPTSGLAAEDTLLGSYRGNYTAVTMHGQVPFGVDLDIDYAKDGVVHATMTEHGHRPEAGALCNGNYDMRGTYEGNHLKIGTKSGGDGGTCARFFDLVKEGDSLVGTTPRGQRVELRRR